MQNLIPYIVIFFSDLTTEQIVIYTLAVLISLGLLTMLICDILIFRCKCLIKRNEKVGKFRLELIDKLDLNTFNSLPSYNEMLYSFKPLKYKYWLIK